MTSLSASEAFTILAGGTGPSNTVYNRLRSEMPRVQLPANLFRIQAPATGKVMLMDVQQEGSLRQVFRSTRNQTPFAVVVDEFYNFADLSIIDSLNKLRDANI